MVLYIMRELKEGKGFHIEKDRKQTAATDVESFMSQNYSQTRSSHVLRLNICSYNTTIIHIHALSFLSFAAS